MKTKPQSTLSAFLATLAACVIFIALAAGLLSQRAHAAPKPLAGVIDGGGIHIELTRVPCADVADVAAQAGTAAGDTAAAFLRAGGGLFATVFDERLSKTTNACYHRTAGGARVVLQTPTGGAYPVDWANSSIKWAADAPAAPADDPSIKVTGNLDADPAEYVDSLDMLIQQTTFPSGIAQLAARYGGKRVQTRARVVRMDVIDGGMIAVQIAQTLFGGSAVLFFDKTQYGNLANVREGSLISTACVFIGAERLHPMFSCLAHTPTERRRVFPAIGY